MSPLDAQGKNGGGAFVGEDPGSAWVLENGYDLKFDFWVRLVSGRVNTISNWNTAIHDPASGRTLVAGFVSDDSAIIKIITNYRKGDSVADSGSGWKGFSSLRGVCEYTPPKGMPQGRASFESELLFVGMSERSPHEPLESFADAVAAYYGIGAWPGDIPTGWNVWATAYHHAITRENMLENARWAAANLQPYGMETFQIDDGWQLDEGDWEPNEKFPGGMGAIADEIRKLGFRPGLWIAPFVVGAESRLAKDHPDWIAPKSQMADMLMPGDWLILDLSHPEVLRWLDALFRKISREWGYRFIKIDFVYYTLVAKEYHDPALTNVEIYRQALETIRNAVTDDSFTVIVGVPLAANAGPMHSIRIGLDIIPDWADGEGYGTQGVKPMVRNLARRYYLNHRVWVIHPDMFYLGGEEETERWGSRLTLEEARTYATLVAITGGVTKIGNTFIRLTREETDLLRRLLPVNKATARPLDLFEMKYPEVWDLENRIGEYPYRVVTMFNWGLNERYGEDIEEAERTIEVSLDKLGLNPEKEYVAYEFWTESHIGTVSGRLSMKLPPRTVRVVAIHPKTEHPRFLSTNRHVTQGATDIKRIRWLEGEGHSAGGRLLVTLKADKNFDYSIKFFVPAAYRLKNAGFDGEGVETERDGELLTAKFTPKLEGERTLMLQF